MASRDFNTWLSSFRYSIADFGYYIDFAKVYKNVDSDHSTVEGGLINVNVWEDPNYPFKHHIELWAEMGIASKHPTAMLKQTGV